MVRNVPKDILPSGDVGLNRIDGWRLDGAILLGPNQRTAEKQPILDAAGRAQRAKVGIAGAKDDEFAKITKFQKVRKPNLKSPGWAFSHFGLYQRPTSPRICQPLQ